MHRKFWIGKLIFVFIAAAALGWLVMGLWNWILPSLFTNIHPIDYWRALGLLVLCRVLFGGFHGGGWHRHHHMQRWHQMTDEERKKFKEGLMGFGAWHHHHEHSRWHRHNDRKEHRHHDESAGTPKDQQRE